MGDGARRHPARRRDHPGDDAAVARRRRGTGSSAARCGTSSRGRRTPAVFEHAADVTRIAVGGSVEGWLAYADSSTRESFDGEIDGEDTAGDETLLLYFTSGTTASPKLVEHTHTSYPIGHLSTMYWIGLRPGDVHVNVSSPGWAKHAWSSLFAPWNAEATVTVVNQPRFDAPGLLATLERVGVTTFCAPPTVWRMLVQHDLAAWAGGCRCARSSPPASRSTPRSSSRCAGRGA